MGAILQSVPGGIGWRRGLECGESGVGQGKVGRLNIENLLTVEEDAGGDLGGDEGHVIRTLSIEDTVPAAVAELGEGG